jgi:hypothetical protein
MQLKRLSATAIALLGITMTANAQPSANIAPSDQQIAGAVLSAPQDLRASATVLGYDAKGKLVPLRKGAVRWCVWRRIPSPRRSTRPATTNPWSRSWRVAVSCARKA